MYTTYEYTEGSTQDGWERVTHRRLEGTGKEERKEKEKRLITRLRKKSCIELCKGSTEQVDTPQHYSVGSRLDFENGRMISPDLALKTED